MDLEGQSDCRLRGAESAQKKCNYEYQPDFDQICFMAGVEIGKGGTLDTCALVFEDV